MLRQAARARRLVVSFFVLLAIAVIMLARTSPALAADHGHGQGKARDHTSASAVVEPPHGVRHRLEQPAGGCGGCNGPGVGGEKGRSADDMATDTGVRESGGGWAY